ncbi:MAG: hypothetical protein WC058_09685 [Phycisphaeraceae bacterium]
MTSIVSQRTDPRCHRGLYTGGALHLAVSATSGVAILLTWNCRHLANPRTMERAYDVLRSMGLRPPMICTPDELTGDESHE